MLLVWNSLGFQQDGQVISVNDSCKKWILLDFHEQKGIDLQKKVPFLKVPMFQS